MTNGGEWERDIKEYSDIILNTVGKDDSNVTYEEAEPFTTNIKTIDCSKAVKDLKHDPKVTPEEGIRKTVEWMKWYYRLGEGRNSKHDGNNATGQSG